MFGILLVSHGKLAEGILDAGKLFYGEKVEKVKTLCLEQTDGGAEFGDRIREALAELEAEKEGALVLCDLFGGTPANQCVGVLTEQENLKVVTGMNLAMLINVLVERPFMESIGDVDVEELLTIGKDNILDLRSQIDAFQDAEDADSF